MKNSFPLVGAIVATAYPAAVAAELLGILPASVISFPAFFGFFTAAGVLGLAFSEYSRKAPAYDKRRAGLRQPQAARLSRSVLPPGSGWIHHTVSS